MIETYKITSGVYDREVTDGFLCLDANTRTRGNELKLKKRRSKLNIRKYVYTNRITDIWNSLPNVIVRSKNVKNFEIALDRHWSDEDVKFDFKSDISLYTGSHVKSRYTVDDEIEADTVAEMPASTEDPKVRYPKVIIPIRRDISM